MNEIVERASSSSGEAVGDDAREKVRHYIGLLASTGKSDRQLVRYGRANSRRYWSQTTTIRDANGGVP